MVMEAAQNFPLNCGTFLTSGEYDFDKGSIGTDDFYLIATEQVRVLSAGSSSSRTTQDLNLVDVSGASTITDYAINAEWNIVNSYDLISYSNNSGVILAPGENTVSSGIISGSATIFAYKSGQEEVFDGVDITVSSGVGSTYTYLDSYVSGSLSYEVSEEIDTRAQAVTNVSAQTPLFSSYNHSTQSYTRNTSIWTTNTDLTCISPWNSNAGQNKAGTLITPKHIVFAAHYQYPTGTTIRFVSNNNVVYNRTLVSKVTVYKQGFATDITIGKLDSDVGEGVSFAKILPSNDIASKFPNLGSEANKYPVPCMYLRQDNNIYCANQISSLRTIVGSAAGNAFYSTRAPTNSYRLALYSGVRVGDSGGPCFIVINDQAILLGCWYFPTGGPHLAWYKTEINDIIQYTFGDSSYSLSTVDLSSFTSY